MNKLSFFPIVAAALMTCCSTTLKRYDSVLSTETDNNLADIDLFGYSLSKGGDETGTRTLWDLSADAQSQFIKILNSRYPDNDKFRNAMSYKYLKPDAALVPLDYINKDLRMIFSVSKRLGFGERNTPPGYNLSPADRIEYLRISLKIPDDSGLRFTGWNMFSTDYGSIEIADVSFSRNIEIDASGLIPAGTRASAGGQTAGVMSSSGRKEDQAIQYRYLKLNGRLNNNKIELEEEGTREIDLTGNIVADVSVEFERFPEKITEISGLKDSTGRFNEPGKLLISITDVMVPGMENIKDTVYAELTMDYVFRNVLKGQKTFPEWDDRVKFVKGSVSKKVPFLSSADYVPDFYCIGTNQSPSERKVIKIMDWGNRELAVIFRSRVEASSLYEWLIHFFSQPENKDKKIKIGDSVLRFSDSDLTSELILGKDGLRVMPCYK
jgi:hypothetical protein